jgi:hypothetical protein
MDTKLILDELDAEITRLQRVRDLLSGGGVGNSRVDAPKRKPLSAAARKRIGDAQRKRWAKAKKAAK